MCQIVLATVYSKLPPPMSPKEFSGVVYYDVNKGREIKVGNQRGEQTLPVILFTSDKRYAISVYSAELPRKGLKLGYGYFSFPNVNKWNCVFRENNVKPGSYEYRCLIVLGTLEEVEKTMERLAKTYTSFRPHASPTSLD